MESYYAKKRPNNWQQGSIPACPTGPSKVRPSIKLAVIAASFVPRVIISPRFWNLKK
jgi:hypothetical protein